MTATRYCGDLQIRIELEADADRPFYRCEVSDGAGETYTVWVGTPAVPTYAIDSSEAFDSAAHAALSFAADEGWPVEEYAAMTDEGWEIRT